MKTQLAQQFPTDRLAYTEGKSSFIASVLQKALPATALQPGDPVRVRAYKSDGQWYRWWTATVETVSPDLITTIAPPNNDLHTVDGTKQLKLAIRSYYWFDRPYNLLEVYQPDGGLAEIYVNICSPIVQKGAELQFTDHELDVLKITGQPARIVDEDEFATASPLYGYSAEFQRVCRQHAHMALELAEHWVAQEIRSNQSKA